MCIFVSDQGIQTVSIMEVFLCVEEDLYLEKVPYFPGSSKTEPFYIASSITEGTSEYSSYVL